MMNGRSILKELNFMFTEAIEKAYPDVPGIRKPVQLSNGKHGDYKCISTMQICQHTKSSGVQIEPRGVAQHILDNIAPTSQSLVEKFEIAGPGFINVFLKPSYVQESVKSLLLKGVQPPLLECKLRVVIDFSSPNVAKEMHVGHLRSTIIGECLARLLEFLGHNLLRLNHVGDWGTQFGMLIANLMEKFPNYKSVSPPIEDLQAFYKDSKVRFDQEPAFKKRAYEAVVKLQSGDPEINHVWQLICDVSRKCFQKIYDELDVTLIERGESFYNYLMPEIVKELEEKGLVQSEDGRKVMFIEGQSVPLTVQKSDGGFTYDTSDLAAAKHRVGVEKADWIIYVVDSGQSLHFQLVFAAVRKAGFCQESTRLDHVGFGVVLGEDRKRLKTRSGKAIRLIDLLDEGIERARERLKEKKRDQELTTEELTSAEKSLAYGCIKYADLSQTRTNDYVFSFDKMLDDRGNTAVYLLYAYTRMRSIKSSAHVTTKQLIDSVAEFTISHEKELKLAKCVTRYLEVLEQVAEELYPHVLCDYVYEMCTTFTEFYSACYCIEKDRQTGNIVSVNMSRLILCEVTAMVLEKILHILGISVVEKM